MGLFTRQQAVLFPWVPLTTSAQLHDLMEQSEEVPVLLFKHSTSCSISALAKNRFEQKWNAEPNECVCVYLDLLSYRALSNEIETLTGVMHQSPQAILIKNKRVVYEDSHTGISAATILTLL
ncbi:MAG: bacillithiol system redox-active protein YtxJ [Bacteroidota bacterium]